MKTRHFFLHCLALAGAALLLLAAAPRNAHAAFMLTFAQVGADVVVTGSGTINLAGLTPVNGFISGTQDVGLIQPDAAFLFVGTGDFLAYDGLTGPTSFGTGSQSVATSTTGGAFALFGTAGYSFGEPTICVPANYLSETPLVVSDTFANATFSSLGVTPNTYTYTYGTGDNTDTVTLDFVPEPSTWAMLGLGVAGWGLTRRPRANRVVRATAPDQT